MKIRRVKYHAPWELSAFLKEHECKVEHSERSYFETRYRSRALELVSIHRSTAAKVKSLFKRIAAAFN